MSLLIRSELLQELRVQSHVAWKLEVEAKEREEGKQREINRLIAAYIPLLLERVNPRVARFVGLYAEAAGSDHPADCLVKLIAVFRKMTATGANRAVDSRIDRVVDDELGVFGCLNRGNFEYLAVFKTSRTYR